jgi:tRNA (Thr-GGU) A37 N-methylase
MLRTIAAMSEPLPLPVIGVVRSGYIATEQTPIQASLNRAGRATVEIAEPYADGLDGLAGFDYALADHLAASAA